MIKNILNNFKTHFKYDLISAGLLMLWLITSFLFINLDKILFWRSLFYLFIYHFALLGLIILGLRLFTYKLSGILINALYIFMLYNLISKTSIAPNTWYEFINDETLGFKNYNISKIVLLLILVVFTYKKIWTKHLSFIFGLMLTSNMAVNIPNIYNNITVAQEIVESEPVLTGEPLYKNPANPNIYILMVDTYPSFYNTKNYLQFDNVKFKNYLIQNDFTVYEQMYSNRDRTSSSMSVFFGHENIHYEDYSYYSETENAGYYLKQKHLTNLNNKGYKLHNNKYHKKTDLDHNYLQGFYYYLGISLDYKIFNHYLYIDNSHLKAIKYYRDLGYNIVMDSLKTDYKNSITLIFTNEISNNFTCFEKDKYLQGRDLTIHKIKCANENVQESITAINKYDKNSLIILMSDHGFTIRGRYERLHWSDDENKTEKTFGVLFAIHYPKQCQKYNNIKFTSLQDVMPAVIGCVDGLDFDKVKLPKHTYSYMDLIESSKKYIINGVVRE